MNDALKVAGNAEVTPGYGAQVNATDTTATSISVAGDVQGSCINPTANTDPPKSAHLAGAADITLSAPTSGDYKDVLFYPDANTPSDLINVFDGSADTELYGVLYFPNSSVRFSGNGDPGGATSIVARTVYISGNASFGSNSETALFGLGGAGRISLVQ